MPRNYRTALAYSEAPVRRRLSGLGLAIGVNLLLILALLTLGVRTLPQKPSGGIIVDLIPQADDEEASGSRQKPTPPKQPAERKVPPRLPPKIPAISNRPLPWIEISKADMIAGDLANLPKAAPGEGDSEEVGRAPNGEVLYAAEWARRPTNAELSGYIPRNAPNGWGMIACKTIEGSRVDDCIELGQSPAGSHLASAVRQAAWQFRVRPPRKNGVPMIGVWVRIRIDYETIGG